MDTLGIPATDPGRYSWEPVSPGDPDHMPPAQRMLHVVADRIRWQDALAEARRQSRPQRAAGSFGNREGGVTRPTSPTSTDRLLTVEAAAERMSTSVRFVRRLIAQRRIEFVKVGRHVRISESALAEFIESRAASAHDPSRHVAQDEGSCLMANKYGHRRFGNVRRLPSGRYQIRYPGPDGRIRTGPGHLRAQIRR